MMGKNNNENVKGKGNEGSALIGCGYAPSLKTKKGDHCKKTMHTIDYYWDLHLKRIVRERKSISQPVRKSIFLPLMLVKLVHIITKRERSLLIKLKNFRPIRVS